MKNLWSDKEAAAAVRTYGKGGVGKDLALRTYTTRLLGGVPELVLHGGGNTSVKTTLRLVSGEMLEVLCVKGSGWDMGSIEPPGLPAVRLAPLQRLIELKALSDEDMVNALRTNLLDAAAPTPSVETLLHAFLPQKFIDHTHADAVVTLTDQPDGGEVCRRVFGRRVALVPYVMPGFALAKKAAEVYAANPGVEGLILLKHGIFTFGTTAREAYDRMIGLVSLAERAIARARKARGKAILKPAALPQRIAPVAEVAPILRGLLAIPVDRDEGLWRRFVLDFRASPGILRFVGGRDLARYGWPGTVTPDHVIRTKPRPLVVPAPAAGEPTAFAAAARRALDAYVAAYGAYFARNNVRQTVRKKELDPMPRVILVPGLGLFGAGASAREARVAADLAETNVKVISDAEAVGRYETLSEADLFDLEYWSLEQAKLGKAVERPLARHVVVVTGGGSGIGAATAAAFAAEGAEVAVLDRDGAAAAAVARQVKGLGIACDVTDAADVRAAFDAVACAFGGADIVVSNAGAAWQGRIGDVDEAVLRQSFELNFFAHQTVAQNALRVFRAQGLGGVLLFNTSKQAVNPGRDFGPYGLPKAATLFLMKQYALDHGREGVRACAVNADRIRSGLLTEAMVAARAKARGISAKDYMAGNLLGREVTAADVARAFVHLALSRKTTAAVLTVDGGNIEAALR
jgi:rhamnose utilization protein RhaD (predicted bifunctional aldolase and dehydrogenase)/NAD(P)-dependent dehydrogenase (short-subunit alcohol dehydrogenase family)